MGRLTGKNALVTGGGTGIGFGITEVFLREGASVTIAARREDVLAEAVDKLVAGGIDSSRIQSIACDVTNEEQVSAAVTKAARGENLDVLVNNAGSGMPGVLMNLDADGWRFCTEVNIVGPALCMKHAALHMKDEAKGKVGGSIINISSVSATKYQPWLIAYNTTKAGLDMMTKSAAIELAQHKIRVNAVSPGFVKVNEHMQNVEEAYAHITPARRHGRPSDIAEGVLFFADDASEWVTGQVLGVDGGVSVPLMVSMGPTAKMLYGDEAMAEFDVEDYRSVPDAKRNN
jgi:NAD(P)-dependent dehydrogenase (short-subunit alcohol dehydrogenase family)